ncbi:hypothetical protein RYH80_01690 [Halobaculum sp. MBLA0147]|uniref:hypothetical protein n=1 Tax=Halobaculum sp. MBLA0147 TaxID=3079934 RepID=UPI0035236C84
MTTVPPDVHDVLAQLHRAAIRHGETDDAETFTAAVETAETVVENKLPEGRVRETLRHGYDRASATVETQPTVAVEYVRSADRLLASETDRDPTLGGTGDDPALPDAVPTDSTDPDDESGERSRESDDGSE